MFETHKLNEAGLEEVKRFKSAMSKVVTHAIDMMSPNSREAAIFKTKIEEAVFFGTKAIASKDGNHDGIINY